ncbi:hypothetical protein [Arthrobacter sp. A2-55]|uniref:hypothetical protein n=1 Tax=Arthrobacter sp. A2-55 TaxID=2897337 RepID=UPI0021CD9CFB|nr:hypothetical protein [Arthrobacter sp. A2-55]MCU6480554.1 hypothetical protein [Arthrobacter sp. A2-55]
MTIHGFNEADHPRASTGKFATKQQSEAEVSLQASEGTYRGLMTPGRRVLCQVDGEEVPGTVLRPFSGGAVHVRLDDSIALTLSEDDLQVDPDREARRILDAVRLGDETFELAFVDYSHHLSDEQLNDYLAGNQGTLNDSLDEDYYDQKWNRAEELARELLEDAGLEPDADVDQDVLDELRDAIQEKDDSDPLPQLLSNGGHKLMRINLAIPEPDVSYGNNDGVHDERERKLTTILAGQGLDTSAPEARQAINELVTEGPWDWHSGVDLDVIYFGDPRESTILDESDGTRKTRELTFTRPHILLIDRWNGSGHSVQFPGTVRAQATEDRPVRLDSSTDRGYGWDAVAGVVHSAHRTETASHWIATTRGSNRE